MTTDTLLAIAACAIFFALGWLCGRDAARRAFDLVVPRQRMMHAIMTYTALAAIVIGVGILAR